jgi:arabinogalactan oligomer / maltooligosaccharide transport system permease protein
MTAQRLRGPGYRSPQRSVALHATLLAATAIALFPVLWIALVSFKPADGWTHPTQFGHLGFGNYHQLFTSPEYAFTTWFRNSLIVALGTTVLGVLVAASAAYALSRIKFPGSGSLMWTFLITQMFPVAILIVPLYNILAKLHMLNSFPGLVLTYCTISVPFCAWMLKSYFDTIPKEIDEAGRIDGLSPFGTFWRLVLPLARPGLVVTGFYSFITAWGEVAYANQFMTSNDKMTLAVGMRQFVGQYDTQWGLMTAASVLVAIPAVVFFFFAQKHLVAGLTAGGTKG